MKKLGIEEYKRIYGDPDATAEEGFALNETEAEDCRLPKRKPNTHKYSYGRALIIGGCVGFSGAPVLAANACERSGAGLTHLMVPESIYAIAAARCDGAVVTPLEADGAGALSAGALDRILPYLEKAAACAVGPGLGQGEGAHRIVEELLRRAACPLILDADALTICGKKPELLTNCKVPAILTPHEGEFRRLGGNLEEGRLSGARWIRPARPPWPRAARAMCSAGSSAHCLRRALSPFSRRERRCISTAWRETWPAAHSENIP